MRLKSNNGARSCLPIYFYNTLDSYHLMETERDRVRDYDCDVLITSIWVLTNSWGGCVGGVKE